MILPRNGPNDWRQGALRYACYWGVIRQAWILIFPLHHSPPMQTIPKNVRSQTGLSNVRGSDCITIDFPTSFELQLPAVARITSPCPRSAAKRFSGAALRNSPLLPLVGAYFIFVHHEVKVSFAKRSLRFIKFLVRLAVLLESHFTRFFRADRLTFVTSMFFTHRAASLFVLLFLVCRIANSQVRFPSKLAIALVYLSRFRAKAFNCSRFSNTKTWRVLSRVAFLALACKRAWTTRESFREWVSRLRN